MRRSIDTEASPAASAGFDVALAPDLVASGAVTPRSARIWVRTERAGRLRIRVRPEPPAGEPVEIAALHPHDPAAGGTGAYEVDGLAPETAYRYEVLREPEGSRLGAGRFETAPEARAPERFAIGLASCNLPFGDDGAVSPRALDMLRAARGALTEERAKLVLWMGDQMYTDLPQGRSLFDAGFFREVGPHGREHVLECSAEEVRRLMQARYHAFWSLPELRELHALAPGYPTWDDHEIVDNWGSDPRHAEPEWRALGTGARLAYFDYQASRVLPPGAIREEALDYTVDYGDVAIRVLDLRSNRTGGADGRILSEAQFGALRGFLASRADRSVVLLVLSVPLVHLPRQVARLGARVLRYHEDFSDRWSSPGDRRDRDALLRTLLEHQRRHPSQKLVLVSGDIHIGCAHSLRWREQGMSIHQLVSSGLTNHEGAAMRRASALAISLNRRVVTANGHELDVRLLPAVTGRNPFTDLNLGVLELRRDAEGGRALRFRLYGQEAGRPYVGYESDWF